MGPHPAVAAIRLAVRRVLHDILTDHSRHSPTAGERVGGRIGVRLARPVAGVPGVPGTPEAPGLPERTPDERTPSPLVLVACSGGADSMALASALAFEAPKLGIRAGGITVDHGLQPGSDLRAEEVVLRLRELG
ncbi:ATP-binding protein, partial [Streptomyces shenzhenensis]|uniref:ATP-binding protein n=1 Tax=Streptomyces shenzhenensis TaxID=943815 RepID=UPI0028681C08